MNPLFTLEGKKAVVIGFATGIGQGLALGLAKAGTHIIALDIADLQGYLGEDYGSRRKL